MSNIIQGKTPLVVACFPFQNCKTEVNDKTDLSSSLRIEFIQGLILQG